MFTDVVQKSSLKHNYLAGWSAQNLAFVAHIYECILNRAFDVFNFRIAFFHQFYLAGGVQYVALHVLLAFPYRLITARFR